MRTRVYYRWKGKDLHKDVTAAPADAAAVFRHTVLGNCEILRVEALGEPAAVTGTPGAKPTAGLPPLRPITEEESITHRRELAALRAQLARLPKPAPQRRR